MVSSVNDLVLRIGTDSVTLVDQFAGGSGDWTNPLRERHIVGSRRLDLVVMAQPATDGPDFILGSSGSDDLSGSAAMTPSTAAAAMTTSGVARATTCFAASRAATGLPAGWWRHDFRAARQGRTGWRRRL
jgi:hypothetical protein